MKPYLRLWIVSLSLLTAADAFAQQVTSPPPSRDATAVALLGKSLAVMTGGLPISDVTLQGTARRIAGSDDETGPAVLKATADGNSRIDLSSPSGPRAEVRTTSADGPNGQWTGPDRTPRLTSQHNLMTEPSWFFPAFIVARAIFSESYAVSYVGQEKRGDRVAEHVMVYRQFQRPSPESGALLQHLSQMEIYLDSSTLLPVALSFNIHPDDDAGLDIPVEILFTDYRAVNSAQVPFHIQKYLNNSLILDFQAESVTLNSGLPQARSALHRIHGTGENR